MRKIVKCPTCKKKAPWLKASIFNPFCSKRCRLIDLGEWASEKYAIPAETIPSIDDLAILLDKE